MIRLLLALNFLFIFGAFATSPISLKVEPGTYPRLENDKIIISRDQIHLTPDGIFINFAGNFIAVDTLYSVKNGEYACDAKGMLRYCPYGHPYLWFQSGCSVETCPFYSGGW